MEIVVAALLLGLVFLILILMYRTYLISGVSYEFSFNRTEVTEGEEIEFTETVSNQKFLPVSWLKSEITIPAALEFSELSSVVTDKTRWVTSFFALKSFSRIRRTWKVRCSKRGVYTTDRIIVTAADPLGLIKNYFIVDLSKAGPHTITVLPDFEEYIADESESGIPSGEVFSRPKLISDPFFVNGIREYRITDPMKNINWFATAREQQLMVNCHDYTSDREVTVILNIQSMETDQSTVFRPHISEKCIRLCAAVIRDSCRSGRMVRFVSNDITSGEMADISSSDEYAFYRMLSSFDLIPGESFGKFLLNTASSVSGGEIIVISPFRTEEFELLRMQNPNVSFIVPDISGGGTA